MTARDCTLIGRVRSLCGCANQTGTFCVTMNIGRLLVAFRRQCEKFDSPPVPDYQPVTFFRPPCIMSRFAFFIIVLQALLGLARIEIEGILDACNGHLRRLTIIYGELYDPWCVLNSCFMGCRLCQAVVTGVLSLAHLAEVDDQSVARFHNIENSEYP